MSLLQSGNRTSLDSQPTASVVERIVATFNALFLMEHRASGGHTNVSLQTLDLTPLTAPVLTASANNYSPTGIGTVSYLRVASTGAVNITGLYVPTTTRVLWIRNVGAQNITLMHQDTASTAPGRFQLPNAANLTLGAGEGVQLLYDRTDLRWGTVQQ